MTITDSRLNQATALLDDARTALADIIAELAASDADYRALATARIHINAAIMHTQSVKEG